MSKPDRPSISTDLKNLLDKKKVGLLVTSSDRYHDVNREIMEFVIGESDIPGIYVTVNRSAVSIREDLNEKGISTDNVLFVDTIARHTGEYEEKDDDNIIYLDSPKNLTDISIVISQAMEQLGEQQKFIFFDTLSTLTVYNDENEVNNFAHHITGRLRSEDVPGILLLLREMANESLIAQLTQFCDTVVEI